MLHLSDRAEPGLCALAGSWVGMEVWSLALQCATLTENPDCFPGSLSVWFSPVLDVVGSRREGIADGNTHLSLCLFNRQISFLKVLSFVNRTAAGTAFAVCPRDSPECSRSFRALVSHQTEQYVKGFGGAVSRATPLDTPLILAAWRPQPLRLGPRQVSPPATLP